MSQQTPFSEGGSTVNVIQPDPEQFGDVSVVERIQKSLPKYQGINPYTLKARLLQDDDYYNQFTSDYLQVNQPDSFKKLAQADPEQYTAVVGNFKKNFRKDLTKASYQGEAEKDTLVRRTLELTNSIDQIPVETYKDIVSSNSKTYESYGLIEDGSFVYGDSEADNLTFSQAVANDPELHSQIIRDRYNQFEKKLADSHNNPSVLSDPTKKSQAWVVYNNFGSEGLTQYINVLQGEQGSTLGDSYSAKEYFQDARANGKSASELVQDFIVGSSVKGTEYDDLINQSSQYGVSPALMAGMIRQESNFDSKAISSAGAVGLVQYMPTTAREAGLKVPDELYELDVARMNASGEERRKLTQQLYEATKRLSTEENDERFDPEKSVQSASKQMSQRLQRYNFDPEKAVASWNAGMGRVDRAIEDSSKVNQSWKEFIPQQETAPHIQKVMGYAQEYGSPTSLAFSPVTPNKELRSEIPEDLNTFTEFFYEANTQRNGVNSKETTEVTKNFLKTFAPENYEKFLNPENLSKNGEFSEEFGQLGWNVYEWASKTENIDALMETVKGAGEFDGNEEDPTWRLNYAQLNPKQKIALNALRYDREGEYMVQYIANGVYDFRPKRRQVSQGNFDWIKNLVYDTKEELYQDENGDFKIRIVPEKGGLSGMWNSIATVGLGVADMAMRFFYEPAVRTAGKLTQHEGTKAYADYLRDWTGVDLAEGLTEETDGMVPNAIGEVAPFIEYMGSMFIGGSAIIRGGAKAFSVLTNAKKVFDFQRYATQMAGAKRIQAMAAKLSQATSKSAPWATASITKRSPWVTGAGVFYTGGAAIEATQPTDTSFLTNVPEMLGYEPTNDLAEFYKTSSYAQKKAMDVGASLVMDGFFDTMIAGTKFLSAKAGQKFFDKKEFKGIIYRGEEYGNQKYGGYEVVDQPQFRHDLREFWANMTNELDRLPMGSVGESTAKTMTKGMEFNSLHDFTKVFVDDSEQFMGDVRKDISDNIRFLNDTIGDGKMTDEQLSSMVDEQYEYFINNLSQSVYGTLRNSSAELPIKFSQTLEEQTPTIKRSDISVNEMDDYSNKNLIRKGDDVYEVDPKYWTIDLANKVREKSLEETEKQVANRKITPDTSIEKAQEIKKEVAETIGTPVNIKGKTGYVVDFNDSAYMVRTSDGDIMTIRKGEANVGFKVKDVKQSVDQQANKAQNEKVNKAYSERLKQTAQQTGKFVNKQLKLDFC